MGGKVDVFDTKVQSKTGGVGQNGLIPAPVQ